MVRGSWIGRPTFCPIAPPGFKVELFATDLNEPRAMVTAPNGDIFLAESHRREHQGLSRHWRRRQAEANGDVRRPDSSSPTASRSILRAQPAVHLHWRTPTRSFAIPYNNGDLKASGEPEKIADLPGGGYHWTRDLVFSQDGKQLFVGVGSDSNIDDPDTHPKEKNHCRHPGDGSRWQEHARIRIGYSQCRRRTGDQSQDRRAVVLDQRTRWLGQQPGARLH